MLYPNVARFHVYSMLGFFFFGETFDERDAFSHRYCGYLSSPRISFHSTKQPQYVPHLFKNASLVKEPLFSSSSSSSSTNPTLSSPVSRLHPCPASNCRPIQSQKTTKSVTAFADGLASPTLKRKKKKKKRRHSEMENPTAELLAKTEQDMPELIAEMRDVKCKKRKREEEPNSIKVQREDVPSGQDEDWCLGEMWRINPDASSEKPKQQSQLTTEQKLSPTQKQIQLMLCETPQNHHDSTIKTKKKKHKEKLKENIKHETSERLVVFSTFSTAIPNSFIFLTNVIHLLDTTIFCSFIERLR